MHFKVLQSSFFLATTYMSAMSLKISLHAQYLVNCYQNKFKQQKDLRQIYHQNSIIKHNLNLYSLFPIILST